jgi:L-arabinose isomerase
LQPKVALVTVASTYEQGFEDAEKWMDMAERNLRAQQLVVYAAKPVLFTDRLNVKSVCEKLKTEQFDLLIILHGTWTTDALQFEVMQQFSKPTLLWALPFPKTYSLPSIIHFGSVLKQLGIRFSYVYGAPEDQKTLQRIAGLAKVSRLTNLWNGMRVGRVGRRSAWRVMGPFDTTYDELDWELARGPRSVTIDIKEFLTLADNIPDNKAREIVENLKKNGKVGTVEVEEKLLLDAARIYSASKDVIKRYALDALTIECYPYYPGLDNVASGWLSEEGIILNCEGEMGHMALSRIMQELSGKAVALIEPTGNDGDALIMMHDGSGAPSLSEGPSSIVLKPVSPERARGSERTGIIVNSSVRPGKVTMATMWGRNGSYNMSIVTGTAIKLNNTEVEEYGGGLVAKVKLKVPATVLVERLIDRGADHHMMLTPADISQELVDFCKMTGIQYILPDSNETQPLGP